LQLSVFFEKLNEIKMKVILDIKENDRVPFFMELVKSLDYIRVLKEVKDERKSEFITGLVDAFNDVKLYEQGKKKLKSAKELLNEF
jgi:hypothetical protein